MTRIRWYRVNTEYNWGGSASAPVHNEIGRLSLRKVARVLNNDLNNPDTISCELVRYDCNLDGDTYSTKSEIIKKWK